MAEGADGERQVAPAAAVLEEGGGEKRRLRLHGGKGPARLGLDLGVGGLGDGETAGDDVVGARDGTDVALRNEGDLDAAVDVVEGRGVQWRQVTVDTQAEVERQDVVVAVGKGEGGGLEVEVKVQVADAGKDIPRTAEPKQTSPTNQGAVWR